MNPIDHKDRSAFSAFRTGPGVALLVIRIQVCDPPGRRPYRRLGPVYKIDPPGTCPICFGLGYSSWDEPGSTPHQTLCWHCRFKL